MGLWVVYDGVRIGGCWIWLGGGCCVLCDGCWVMMVIMCLCGGCGCCGLMSGKEKKEERNRKLKEE